MKQRPRILFISYNSLIEPLGLSQIVSYVRLLAADYRMTVLSFEKAVRSPQDDERDRRRMKSHLEKDGVEWVRLRYHKRPSLLATIYDIVRGIYLVSREHAREPFALVHARGYVPGAIAWGLKRLLGLPYIFDIRGIQAEEYVDAGHWDPRGISFRITKRVEQWILHDADGLVTLTNAIRPILCDFPGLLSRPALPPWNVIPSCVDLDHFFFREEGRKRVRAELGVGDRPILVYAGSVGTWYLLDEMLDFYGVARNSWPDLFFLILANTEPENVSAALRRFGIDERKDAAVRRVRFEEMPDYLSASDAGIAFIRPCLSKLSSCPTKYAEYLACGLPIVVNSGVGDVETLVKNQPAGVLIEGFNHENYTQATKQMRSYLFRNRNAFREIAVKHFSMKNRAYPAYRDLYDRVLARRPVSRVLFLTPYPPHCAPSQRLKFEQYYTYFEDRGIQVVVSPFVCSALWKILYNRGHLFKKILFTFYGYLRRLRDFFRAHKFDAMYLHLWAVPFGPPWFEEALARRGTTILYDIDDLIYLPRASQANTFATWFRKEKRIARIMQAARHVIVSSEYLRSFAIRYNPFVTRISSTIDTDTYYPRIHSVRANSVTIGWSGSHSTSSYLHLLAPILQQLSSTFDVKILVIGDAQFRMEGVKLEARPWNLKRETLDLREIDIGIYPLPDEEWVLGKSGLKALQYMGVGVPVVASAIGSACDFIRHGENGFLARTTDEWVECLSRLILDPDLRRRIGSAGRLTVEEYFSVKVNAPVYLSILESVLSANRQCENSVNRPVDQKNAPATEAVRTTRIELEAVETATPDRDTKAG